MTGNLSNLPLSGLLPVNGQTGSYVFTFSGGLRRRCPEVGFGTCAENTSNARGSRWSDLLSLSEPQFSIACGDRQPHSLPRSFTRLIFSPLPLRRQSPFGVGLMWLLGSPVRAESDLALLIASTLSTPTACFRCVYRLCSGRNRTL